MTRSRLVVLCILSASALGLMVLAATGSPAATTDKIGAVALPPPPPPEAPGKPTPLPVGVYGESFARTPWTPSGYMEAGTFKYDGKCTDNPHSGKLCAKVDFTATKPDTFGGLVWQDPANDWGDKQGGFILSGCKSLVVWARGDKGGEKVTFGYGIGTDGKKFHDSSSGSMTVELTKEWRLYALDVSDKNLVCVKSGFYWSAKGQGKPITFYFDDVEWVQPVVAGAQVADAKAKEIKLPMVLYGNGAEAKLPYEAVGRIGIGRLVAMNTKSTEYLRAGSKACLLCEVKDKGVRAGAVWQDPPNDMGDKPGGHNLTGASMLTFWARGKTGFEKVTFGYGLIGMDKKYADSSSGVLKDVPLGLEWKQFSIPLGGKDMSMIKTGFYWVVDGQEKPTSFFLDDIQFVSGPGASSPAVITAPQPVLPAGANPAGSLGTSPPSSGPPPPGSVAARASVKQATMPFILYGEAGTSWPFQPTGWMGKSIAMNMHSMENPHAGKECIRVDYNDTQGMAGVVWQDPANDWGSQPGGYNLVGARQLSFWARGATGTEKVTFGVGLLSGKSFNDSVIVKLENVPLTTEWKQYFIPLVGKDLSQIKSGFFWRLDAPDKPMTFFLDDIQFE